MNNTANIEGKAAIRKIKLSERSALPEHIRIAYSRLVEKSLSGLLKDVNAQKIHCYLSYRSEVDTSSIIKSIIESGGMVIVPYVKDMVLHHSIFEKHTICIAGEFGIPEPKEKIEAVLTELDAVIVPLAAFDGFGNRVGYGKGYYDTFLSTLPSKVKKIGVAYSIQEVDLIPSEAHDVRLETIVTEQGIITASRID